jgi:alcohol dehydrogenase class IV
MNAAKKLVPILREFLNLLDIPKDFSYLGIDFTEEAIDQLAEDAMNDHGTVHFNPRKAYKEDIINIYKKVLKS